MPNLDDEQFERYLKRFRPLTAEALPLRHRSSPLQAWRLPLAASITVLLILAASALLFRPSHLAENERTTHSISGKDGGQPVPPLTVGSANSLLTRAPSFKEAVDNMAFRPPTPSFPDGKQSALAVLQKERFKL